MIAYLDTSALVKLVHAEAESAALHNWLTDGGVGMATSVVGRVELTRVALIKGGAAPIRAAQVLNGVTLIPLHEQVQTVACTLPPTVLRSLDAIHVATALAAGDAIGAFVTYDARMIDAARDASLDPISPGR